MRSRPSWPNLGIELSGEEAVNAAFARFKDLVDRKREIFDEDLHALLSDGDAGHSSDSYKFISLKVATETGETPLANIVFAEHGVENVPNPAVRPGGRGIQGHRIGGQQRRRTGAVLGECHHQGHRIARRSHRAPGARRPHRQRPGRRHRHYCRQRQAYLSALNRLSQRGERMNPQTEV